MVSRYGSKTHDSLGESLDMIYFILRPIGVRGCRSPDGLVQCSSIRIKSMSSLVDLFPRTLLLLLL